MYASLIWLLVGALKPGLALQVPSRACGRLAFVRRCLEHRNASNICIYLNAISEITLPLALKETSSALPRVEGALCFVLRYG